MATQPGSDRGVNRGLNRRVARVPDAFAAAVIEWAGPQLRDLPWRRTRDPWAIVVSEIMLQQTQAARVIPKYLAFLDRFPTPAACAASSLGDVLRLWHGLGYPRRARNLHLLAAQVTAAGSFPDTLAELLLLPGVGPYTARAVLAFAGEADVAVVDTNIARVYARVVGRRLTATEVQAVADATAPVGDGWLWNQAIMDLGATRCRPAATRCHECPVATMCAWHAASGACADGVDPAVGSARVSTAQARFEGSDRQARGRVLAAIQDAPLPTTSLAEVMQRDQATADRLIADLVADGLATVDLVTVDRYAVRLPT